MGSNSDIIVDELLTFIISYNSNSNVENIKKSVISFYSPEEIIESKKLLWSVCSDKLENYVERKSTDKRTSAEANFYDIINAINNLDADDNVPQFAAVNLNKIPKFIPEELNTLSIINRLNFLENKFQVNSDILADHSNKLFELSKLKLKDNILSKPNAKTVDCDILNIPSVKTTDCDTLNISSAKTTDCDALSGPNTKKADCDTLYPLNSGEVNNFKNDILLNSENTSADANTDNFLLTNREIEEFIEDLNKRTSSEKGNLYPSIEHLDEKNILSGSTTNKISSLENNIKPRYFTRSRNFSNSNNRTGARLQNRSRNHNSKYNIHEIFISRVSQGNNSSIKHFLKNRHISVVDIAKTSHTDSKFLSFKITVNTNNLQVLLSSNFWPAGVKCTQWRDNPREFTKYENEIFC